MPGHRSPPPLAVAIGGTTDDDKRDEDTTVKYIEWAYLGNRPEDVIYCCFAKSGVIKGRMGGSQIRETPPPDALSAGFAFKNGPGFTGTIAWSILPESPDSCFMFAQEGLFTNGERPAFPLRPPISEGAGEPMVAATAKQAYWGNNSSRDLQWVMHNHQMGIGKLQSSGSSIVHTLPVTSDPVHGGFVVRQFKGRTILLFSGCPTSGMTACMIADDELP
jgi:hypothetical protein